MAAPRPLAGCESAETARSRVHHDLCRDVRSDGNSAALSAALSAHSCHAGRVPAVDRDHIIAALVRHARSQILLEFDGTRTCIQSTLVAVETLAHFHLTAEPFPVRVRAMNGVAAAAFRGWPGGATGSWTEALPSSGHSPLTALLDLPHYWDGHLVTICGGQLIDLSADQFFDPRHHLRAQPLAISVSRDFLRGNVMAVASCQTADAVGETLVVYEALRDWVWRLPYRTLRNSPRIQWVVRRTVRAIQRDLGMPGRAARCRTPSHPGPTVLT